MRTLIAKLQAKARAWLLGDVQKTMDCLLLQSALVVGTGENLVRQNGLVLADVARLRQELATLVTDSFARNAAMVEQLSQLAHNDRELFVALSQVEKQVFAVAEMKASVDRLVELVTPKAERLQGRRPVLGGWDEVLSENARTVAQENATPATAAR